ncbi:MAG: nitroreductase family protein [Nitrospirae bacterium]|nr:MAG: nitroreductase family protein [Nitrospirota bacterium]
MDVLEAIKKRRSIRRFQDREIEKEKIDLLIEALIWAPSAGNLQARRFFFVKNPEIKKALAEAALGQRFVARAPLTIVACTDARIGNIYGMRGVNLYAIQDVACSIMNMMLLAHSLGLGTVWVGAFDEERVSEILSLPEHLRPVAIVPVGYPERIPPPPPRVSPDEAIVWVE